MVPGCAAKHRLAAALAVATVAVALLPGCAAVATVTAAGAILGGAKMAAEPDYAPLGREVTNKATFFHPAPQVFATLQVTVERNGRVIVGSEPAAYTLQVSYPFSWLSNNWGGVLTITCSPGDDTTLLLVVGSGRDSTKRLRLIGDEIIADLTDALAHLPATP